MQPSDSGRIVSAIGAMAELFGKQLTEAALELYARSVIDLGGAAVERAVSAAAVSCKFFPSPAELRDLAGRGQFRAADRAAMAFQALKEACSRYGAFRSPNFDDPLINATVRNLGGWTRACEMPVSEFDVWYRRQFCEVYEMFARLGATPEQSARLIGEHEAVNAANGHQVDPRLTSTDVQTRLPWTQVRRLEHQPTRN